MSATELEFVTLPTPMDADRRLSIQTPSWGHGILSIGEDRVRASWDEIRLPSVAPGTFQATLDVTLDVDGSWTVGDASVLHADGRPIERLKVDAAREGISAWARSEGLAAVAEGFLVYPNALLHALRAAEPFLEDEALASGLERVVEMMASSQRLAALAEAVDARAKDAQPVRERLEELAFSMRESHAPSL